MKNQGTSKNIVGEKGAKNDSGSKPLPEKSMNGSASDGFGDVSIPNGSLWGAQTQRSLHYFKIGKDRFDNRFIMALVSIKRACAQANHAAGLLADELYEAILAGCDDILAGRHCNQFPLSVWQTGSGTQTNMNVNEVISSLANSCLSEKGGKNCAGLVAVHPNDHVNMSQSSNDVFPSAMHIVVTQMTGEVLFPALDLLDSELARKESDFNAVYTVGRTHLMDALPLTVGAVLSAFRAQLNSARSAITDSVQGLYRLAIGGTAVGSGSNAPCQFGQTVCVFLEKRYALPFKPHSNLFAAVSGEEAMLRYSAATKQLASVLFKMANDFRLLGSGPRCGLNEWQLPANEPGSSIMPGKVNPTQCEALGMVCLQVFGNDLTVSLAASNGQLQLNTCRPVIIHNVMESIELLSDAMVSFSKHCVAGLRLNEGRIAANMADNLSVVTVLAPQLGYDVAAQIVREAYSRDISLGEAAETLGLYSRAEFKRLLQNRLQE